MEVSYVDLKAQYHGIKTEIDLAVQSVFENGQFIGGVFVNQFESSFAALLGIDYCVGVGNGTDALFIALKSLGVTPGDEVITPAFAWISSAETITLAGGKPAFCDISASDFTINAEQIESKITTRTKGVILVHLYGQAAQAHKIKQICERHGLFLIEDCAQAHLTEEFGVPVGKIGDVGTFSFYPTKNLGAYGDAGCIVTPNEAVEKKMRLYANHGGLKEHIMEGVNSRLDPLQAAVLTVKCKYLLRWTAKRIAHAKSYDDQLKALDPLTLPQVRPETKHTFHQYVVRASRRNELKKFLTDNGIQTMIHYPSALHNLPAYRYLDHRKEDFTVANQYQEEVLSLPVHPDLSEDQIAYVCEKIKLFYKKN